MMTENSMGFLGENLRVTNKYVLCGINTGIVNITRKLSFCFGHIFEMLIGTSQSILEFL